MKKGRMSLLEDDKYYYGLMDEKEAEEHVELSFLFFSLEKFARWYLSFADVAMILSPEK
ncbi:hypothetical protein [Limibacterium fermenti]|uniref:hypothetical protein n=1 Tax=Limibacterium fermenti TaxID=3229863 RepID=UPI003A657536